MVTLPFARRIAWPVLLSLTLLLTGCGAQDREAKARAVAEGYLQALKDKSPDKAMTFFAPTYFETRSPAGWKADLRLITNRLGPLQSYSLRSASSRTDFVPPDSGIQVTLQYDVRYARHSAVETFIVLRPFTRNEYKIVSHSIASAGFTRD